MKRFPRTQYNNSLGNDRGASTFQLIALVAVVLILIMAAYTTIKSRSGEIDAANNAWMDNQVQLWRENGNPGPPYQGMTYQWDVSDPGPVDAPGDSSDGGNDDNADEEEDEEDKEEEEECDTGFWGGVGSGLWDMVTGIGELAKLLWEILVDFDEAKEKLGAMAEQLKELAKALGSVVKNTLNPWGDRDKALADLIEVLETVFPEIADAFKRGCEREAFGRLTVEIATIAVSFTKTSKLIKLIDAMSPQQFLKWFENLGAAKQFEFIQDLSPAERKAKRDKLAEAGAPCSLLGAFGNSFSASTLVLTPDGLVAISTIEIGDLVLAYHETTGEVGSYPVTATMAHLDPEIVLLTIEDELIETTPDHPFYVMEDAPWLAHGQVAGRWVVAEELERGDDIRKLNGSTGDVTSIELVAVDQWMYNLTVAEAHTFFVGQGEWLVHNICKFVPLTGFGGRLERVTATVNPSDIGTGTATNASSRALARELGLPTDQAGHAIGNKLGGPGGSTSNNIFPQNGSINMGAYRAFEKEIADRIQATGKAAEIDIKFEYPSSTSTRPTSIIYEVTIDGETITRTFPNPP